MRYTIEKHERYVVIEPLCDSINAEEAAFLKGEFMLRNTSGQRNIVLDLLHVNEIDADGTRVGLLAHRLCKTVGGLFILTGLQEQVLHMLKVAKLESHFIIAASLSEAEDIIFGNEIQRELLKKNA
ncbi:STAS domain-containing protein [Sphingobacterium sp. SGG-5]|uniref:STAS domain-containing protein n=1 Tax=Sphingobacterium sp. SGG-5 TaxID=2710881 RepID=UPI0013EB8655|nr:STAS domain-containing protein [Sphingobacterium sp. SGG-5]NGM62588.1 STAS domain-containing protein [Sphingobacterium sp. SGG-5]